MASPQPAPALKKSRPESHAFEQVAAPALAEEPPAVAEAPATPAASRTAATAATGNGAEAPAPAAKDEVKFSIRVPPATHRAIKMFAVERGMSIQDLAVIALSEYFERQGHPLP